MMDLNLIRMFIAIFELRSVSRAAEELNVTQPTASYALARLRTLLEDPLFVRSRDGMTPTTQALRIYPDFVASVRRIEHTVERHRAFDPTGSARRFTLAMSDIGEMIFLPPIMARLRESAPHIEIEVTSPSHEDLLRGLASGEITAAVGNFAIESSQVRHSRLFTEHYTCLLSRSHLERLGRLTREAFVGGRHVRVRSAATGHILIEEALRRAGVDRRIALSIQHYAILSHVIAESDLLAILPSRVAAMFERYEAVHSVPIPFDIPSFDVQLHWHKNDDVSTASRWLRSEISSVLRDEPFPNPKSAVQTDERQS